MRYFFVTYLRQPGGQIDEQVGYSKRIRDKDLQTVNIIIDYKKRVVVKCVIEGQVVPTSFEKLDEYYREVYPSLIEQLSKVQASEPEAKE